MEAPEIRQQERAGQQQQLQRIFALSPVATTLFAGPEFRITLANEAMSRIFGRPLAFVTDQPVFDILPDLRNQGLETIVTDVYQNGTPYAFPELPVWIDQLGTGEPVLGHYKVTYQPYRDPLGQILGVLALAIDVTDQVRARQQVQDLNEELTATNEKLNESNTQLTRTNVDLDTFVYTASHDLKAPIANIESIVLALRDTLPPAVQQQELVAHLLDLLDKTVARFQFTIGQLTDISKLQLAHAGPAEPIVLAQVVDGVRLDLAPALQTAGTQLTVAVAPELVVSFSPANLRSVVYNLLSNAVKYRALDRPSRVQMRAEQMSHGVVLTVQDNGLGMSAVQQRQLFGLFQRLHTHVEGTGVGLYITKRLIENAGGTITVHSQPDAGTTFTVTFPA